MKSYGQILSRAMELEKEAIRFFSDVYSSDRSKIKKFYKQLKSSSELIENEMMKEESEQTKRLKPSVISGLKLLIETDAGLQITTVGELIGNRKAQCSDSYIPLQLSKAYGVLTSIGEELGIEIKPKISAIK